MARKGAKDRATDAILGLASGQHGVLARSQLAELGVSDDQLLARAAAGWLIRLHNGVYAVGAHALSWRSRWTAAVLACGNDAVLSHTSAAALWKLTRPRAGVVEVTVPSAGGRRSRAGIKLHRSTTLTAEDLSTRDAIPVTSPRRTIIDLARAGWSPRPLERLLDEADRHRLLDPGTFNEGFQPVDRRLPKSLRVVLTNHQAGSTLTRSELEERFLALCRASDVPAPLVNAPLLGLTVDFLWPQAALIVELDGRGSHDTRRAFQEDRDRDSMLVAAGFRVLRFTWWDVTSRPGVVVGRLRRALAG
jgi:Protein of unknown function (DUF559)/Transcriptional regulator, AbiEi antitoxin